MGQGLAHEVGPQGEQGGQRVGAGRAAGGDRRQELVQEGLAQVGVGDQGVELLKLVDDQQQAVWAVAFSPEHAGRSGTG